MRYAICAHKGKKRSFSDDESILFHRFSSDMFDFDIKHRGRIQKFNDFGIDICFVFSELSAKGSRNLRDFIFVF